MTTESPYQADLIRRMRDLYPDCMILKNDSGYLQGVPDIIILWNDRWAMLEVKRSEKAPNRPNQTYWVRVMNQMSFAAFISPENEEEVLDALEHAFTSRRRSRVSQR